MIECAVRTLEELVARHELEPTIKDIYVEGSFDQEVLSRCIEKTGKTRAVVYRIDSVEIPSETLRYYGLTAGNKQRVIVLAKTLASIKHDCSYRCIVDKDLDHWLGVVEEIPRLIWTKYCALELYFFTTNLLRDILIVTAKARIIDFDKAISSLVEILRSIYALRLADRELGWAMDWLRIDDHLHARASSIEFAEAEYVKRLLMKNGKYGHRMEFEASRNQWLGALVGEPRNYIRGHDLIDVLVWAVRAFRGLREFASRVVMERLLILNAGEVQELLELLQ
jgi:hypothetical protein